MNRHTRRVNLKKISMRKAKRQAYADAVYALRVRASERAPKSDELQSRGDQFK